MAIIPAPIRAGLGLAATAVDTAQQLLMRAPQLPVEAVGNTMQLSMKAQQRYQELVAKGDEILSHLIGAPAQPPSWATFDDDADDAPGRNGTAAADSAAPPAAEGDGDDADTAGEGETAGTAAVFDDDSAAGPLFTHGDPLLDETPVMKLPAKRPPRKPAGTSRRRVATGSAPTGVGGAAPDDAPPATAAEADAGPDADADADADANADGNLVTATPASATDLSADPAPDDPATVDIVPLAALLAETAGTAPSVAGDVAPVTPLPGAPGRKAPSKRGTSPGRTARPRAAVLPSDVPGQSRPAPDDPAVQQPVEPIGPDSRADTPPTP